MTELLSHALRALRDQWLKEADELQSDGVWDWGQSMRLDALELDPLILRCEELEQQQARVDALEAALRGLTDWVDDSPDVYAAGLISAARAALAASAERRQTTEEEKVARVDSNS
jgi:hypothetical protein